MHIKVKQIVFTFLIILTVTAPAFAGAVPDTGQTKCYDPECNEEPCAEIPCEGTGQDGAYIINPMSYTKLDSNGNELLITASSWAMVQDNVTGLIWEVKQNKDDIEDYSNPHDADNKYTWYDNNPETNGGSAGKDGDGTDTLDFINALNAENFGSYSDWRLPTQEELFTIVDYSISAPAPSINTVYFSNTIESYSYYWSSNTSVGEKSQAWCVNIGSRGGNNPIYKSYNNYVRAVRRDH